MKKVYISFVLQFSCFLILPMTAREQADTLTYIRQEVIIPMRDGTKLFTVIYSPSDVKEALPILLFRTPYGVDYRPSPNSTEYVNDMAREGYIFVYQDIRGRFRSEGIFSMLDLYKGHLEDNETDEGTDTYDTIEWLIKNVQRNNGKVGIYGVSADGTLALIGTLRHHPALKAASVQAPGNIDWFLGDDYFHNGAFRLNSTFEFTFRFDYSKETSFFPFDKYDTYEWYLNLGSLANVNLNYYHNSMPTWNNFVLHPYQDDFYRNQSLVFYLTPPDIPILHVAGWWDQEDFRGTLKAYEVLEKNDRNNQNFLVIGPWNHGGWMHGTGESLGKLNFGTATSQKFRSEIQAPFFAYYLKGEGEGNFPEAMIFQTASNTWKSYSKWPPVDKSESRNLYLDPGGKLTFSKPADSDNFNEYLSDPFHPVPFYFRPVRPLWEESSLWDKWMLADQRFVHNRPDVAGWETDPLTEDIEVTGNLLADIFASTTGTDADWVVKLIDVYPEIYPEEPAMGGYQLMVAGDVLRGRFRNSFSDPEPVIAGKVYEYKIDLQAIDHVFKKGHKIMVQMQSTWFPVIDRNPQKYVPNIFDAKESDFIATHQRIYGSGKYPSHIELPVVERK